MAVVRVPGVDRPAILVAAGRPRAQVFRERLTGGQDPVSAARWLRGEPRAVALSGAWAGGGILLSSHPVKVAGDDDDPFERLASEPFELEPESRDVAAVVGGGWFGWLGFGLAGTVESLPPPPPRPARLPLFDLAFHDHVVRCDVEGAWWFEALWTEARATVLRQRLAWWRRRLAERWGAPARPVAAGKLGAVGAGLGGHRAAVAETVRRIARGELSQANVCLRLEGALRGDPLDLWIEAVREARPAYAGYIAPNGQGQTVVSLSPELFLRREGHDVLTRPIKGTLPLGEDPGTLTASPKDRAENVMIVDLMRNDLGRVCSYGSVRVDELCALRPAAGVWHLESTVSGRLRPGVGDADLIRATFPPGSVTGAPKVQAMRTIHELEGTAREAYCGAVGLRSPLSGLELNVAIRTLEVAGGRVWLGVGGGVVADSRPSAEVGEALAKAKGVAAAAGLSLAPDEGQGGRGDELAIIRNPRPDPAAGLLETIRVRAGRPLWLSHHGARLRASCRALGLPVSGTLEADLEAAAAVLDEGGLRVRLTATGMQISARALPPSGATTLRPLVLPGGLGAHKWADRSLIDAHSAPGVTPLVCDLDGSVLEAGYAAVLVVADGALIAPPLDGRLLASVSRHLALNAARARGRRVVIRRVTLDDVRAAEAIILTSSLRGPHPGALEGVQTAPEAQALCEELA